MDRKPEIAIVPQEGSDGLDQLRGATSLPLKAVAHLLDGTVVKGQLANRVPDNLEDTLKDLSGDHPATFLLDSGEESGTQRFQLNDMKAVFIVESLEGNETRHPMRFYSHGPEVSGLWIEVRFKDGEIMEGLVHNSLRHITSSGFLMTPTDPGSNNRAVYINKAALTSFRVLGLRPLEDH